jgi:hypothetical protein
MSKITCTVAAVLVALATNAFADQSRDKVACLIGYAGVSLQNQKGSKITVEDATNKALGFANKICKSKFPGGIDFSGSGEDDAIYYMIKGMAGVLFDD